jgi:hypothetical protein
MESGLSDVLVKSVFELSATMENSAVNVSGGYTKGKDGLQCKM